MPSYQLAISNIAWQKDDDEAVYTAMPVSYTHLDVYKRQGLVFFPNDWHLARAFGMAITLALYAAAMLFFVKCAGLGRPGLWMVGVLLWPFGQHYLDVYKRQVWCGSSAPCC